MENPKLCESEYRFMCVVWENEPVSSGTLVKLCAEKLGWKKATTYTVLNKLGEKGFLVNQNATVHSLVSKAEVQTFESESIVDRAFAGSLSSFVAAFTQGRKLSEEEADEIRALIDRYRKEG